jgi:hypothetical protein
VSIFYRPDGATAADFIPFFWNGTYYLLCLKDTPNESSGRDAVGREEKYAI